MIFLGLVLLSCLQIACHDSAQRIVIKGDLQGGGDQLIRLARIDNYEIVPMDSMRMRNGHFEFVLKAATEEEKALLAQPMLYRLSLTEDNGLTTMARQGEDLHLVAEAANMIQTYRVTGGHEAMLIASLDSALTVFVQKTQPLWEEYQQNMDDDAVREKIEKQYNALVEQHTRFLHRFIEAHPTDMASYVAFYQSYNKRSFLNEREDFALLKKLTDNLSVQYPEHPYMLRMQQKIDFLQTQPYDTD